MFSDHDLLVRVNTILDFIVKQNSEREARYLVDSKNVVERITALEVKQASHLETTKANTDDIFTLQKRGNLFDGINAAATAIVAALSFWWGNK